MEISTFLIEKVFVRSTPNYENSDIQNQFLMSKIIRILPFFSLKNIKSEAQVILMTPFFTAIFVALSLLKLGQNFDFHWTARDKKSAYVIYGIFF